jgi:acyl-CoA reductase-like NAD-dependent aldehyde dehydrogenase
MTVAAHAVRAESGLYIDGTWRDGPATLAVTDPATGAEVGRVVAAGPDDARTAVAAAHRAFPGWAALSPDERGAPLRRAYALMQARADELARALTLEAGKPLAEARGEVLWARSSCSGTPRRSAGPGERSSPPTAPASGCTCAAARAGSWPASRRGTSPAR